MNRYDCETVRDLFPVLLRRELLAHEAGAVEAHMAECAECSAEGGIVRLLHATQPAAPAGLEARVLLAVRRPAPVRRLAPARWAMAATVAAAVLGGSIIMERAGLGGRTDLDGMLDASMIPMLSWAAAEDPLLHGSSTLQALSLEELEMILEELGS
jgi:hypothetical protein